MPYTRRLQRTYGKPQQRGISHMRTVVLSLAATGVEAGIL